jgi:hypothetical protein
VRAAAKQQVTDSTILERFPERVRVSPELKTFCGLLFKKVFAPCCFFRGESNVLISQPGNDAAEFSALGGVVLLEIVLHTYLFYVFDFRAKLWKNREHVYNTLLLCFNHSPERARAMSHSSSKPPNAEMRAAVDEAIKELEKLISDPAAIGACPELPGIVLDRIVGRPLDRASEEYEQTTKAYSKMRGAYLKALVLHPIGRSLSLLAVGPEGVRLMESGHSPSSVINVTHAVNHRVRLKRQYYNCHHIIPKSVAVIGGRAAINHPRNFAIVNTTRRGRDQSQNPHHFWHALFLHPQTHHTVDQSNPIYIPRPLFPLYPPITRGLRSAEDLRKHLSALGAVPLPEIWERRILEFSKAAGHKPYSVPKEFHEITQGFGELFKKENRDPIANQAVRDKLAAKAEGLAAEWLPGDACINGKTFGPNHQPKHRLPIIESGLTAAPANQISENGKRETKRVRRHAPTPKLQPSPSVKI